MYTRLGKPMRLEFGLFGPPKKQVDPARSMWRNIGENDKYDYDDTHRVRKDIGEGK